MSVLIDQADRDRFAQEQTRNISVIAPAGVGKTSSIVSRIVHLARLPEKQAVDRLSRLVVVTYSVRAAQQMQQRARVAIRAAGVSTRVQRAFQQTFFGTIHSYCVRLLDRFGHYLGLPSPVGLLQDDTDLWHRFLLRGLGEEIVGDDPLRELFHFYAPDKLYGLGKEISPGPVGEVGPLPVPDLRPLLDYRDNTIKAATMKTIIRAQEAARVWHAAWMAGERFRPLPDCTASDKAADFRELWRETFAPLHSWLSLAALAFGRRVANAYEAFRLDEAVMTYDDQVRLALRALELPAVRRELAVEKTSVLLDEAQDTDPRQFEVLRRVAGLGEGGRQADDQSFCIVGDFQQAIYAPRSDLATYRRVHDEVSAEPRGTSSRLQVTFRCDTAIITLVNQIFPSVLNGLDGQCAFETLVARDAAGPGQVVRWTCPDEEAHAAGDKVSAEIRARHEARFVARRMQELGPAGLGADDWSKVAILCPRKDWLLQLQRELVDLNLPVQLHSSSEQQSDRTPASWLTALIWIAAHPEDTFEIAGVLREILGVSDSDMALFTSGEGDKLRLHGPAVAGIGPVPEALQILREACAQTDSLPLHEAVRQIIDKVELRERLRLIAELEQEDFGPELDALLAVVAARSAEGATLAALAEELRLGLAQINPGEEEIRDAIQLLTSHKAKGLEWQAVIVPYVFRRIESKALSYPRVVLQDGGREIICRDRPDFETQASEFFSKRERQQLQRLLYVMATRARRTLVLVDDEMLYSGSPKRGGWPAGELLGFDSGDNRSVWLALPETTVPLPDSGASETVRPAAPAAIAPLPDLSPKDLRDALTHARMFSRRTTPHRLATHVRGEEAEPEAQAEQKDAAPVADNPGILYGTWWHEFIQTVPWHKPTSAWEQKFAEAHPRSPQLARATREWALFLQSTLAPWLAAPGRLVQVELPFLAPLDGETCLEGVIDLAVHTADDGSWDVIDWKTNRVGGEGSARLVEIYRGQIEAYTRALRQMLGAEVRGSLYLTQTGEWLTVS